MRKLLLTLLTALCCSAGYADGGKVVIVNGQQAAKPVTKLTFSGNDVVMHFSDGTTQAIDMASVVITFDVATALKAISAAEPKDAPVSYYDLNGRQLKRAPLKGGYIMRKGNKIVKLMAK